MRIVMAMVILCIYNVPAGEKVVICVCVRVCVNLVEPIVIFCGDLQP